MCATLEPSRAVDAKYNFVSCGKLLSQHGQERRRGQKQRRAATREEQRRKTAAAAAAAAVADEEQHSQDTKNDSLRHNSAQHGVPLADGSSVWNNGYTPRTSSSAVRPRSSSLTRNDDSYTRQGTGFGSLGDSNGSGGGRPRLSAPSAGSVASPAVRGFSRRSNRKLVRNAINFLCLAGGHLEKKKARVLEVLL